MISLEHLTKDYGGGKGVFDLSLVIPEGEAFGFLGPNGAGKTTTLRMLMGFIRPGQGLCRIGGLDCSRDAAKIQRKLGYIPGEIALMDEMRGLEFIRFLAAYRGGVPKGRIDALLDRFDLDPSGRIRKMSKGMKQKVGIVCAFMHDPDVLLLDEPTSGLDPLMQGRFIDLIEEERARGKTILMSSHMFEEVERTCSRVGILRAGRLAAVDGIDAIKSRRRRQYVVRLSGAAEAEAFCKEPITVLRRDGAHVTVSVGEDLRPFTLALSRHTVTGLDSVRQSLEDVFLHYYGEEMKGGIKG